MIDYSPKKLLLQLFDFIQEVLRNFGQNRLTRHAAALTFSTLLAVAPMMALAFSILSIFASLNEVNDSIDQLMNQFLAPGIGDNIDEYIDQFASQAGKLSFVGSVFFFLTAALLISNIEASFNDIFKVKKGRSFTSRIPVYWALMTLGPICMVGSLSISTYLLSSSLIQEVGDFSGQIHSAGVVLLPFFLEVAAFAFLYQFMPNIKVRLINALIGALVAAILFELSKKGFALYLLNFGNYKVIYGALSALPIFLIWLYLCWIITLVGAQVVSVLKYRPLIAENIEPDIDTEQQ